MMRYLSLVLLVFMGSAAGADDPEVDAVLVWAAQEAAPIRCTRWTGGVAYCKTPNGCFCALGYCYCAGDLGGASLDFVVCDDPDDERCQGCKRSLPQSHGCTTYTWSSSTALTPAQCDAECR
jgi:hypothetical protein